MALSTADIETTSDQLTQVTRAYLAIAHSLYRADRHDFKSLIAAAGLTPADIASRDWSGVNLENDDLRHLDFSHSDLSSIQWRNADVAECWFYKAKLDRDALNQAINVGEAFFGHSKPLRGHTGSVGGAIVERDGRIISWSEDRTLRLWTNHGEPLQVLSGHRGAVTGAALVGTTSIVSWGSDCAVILWDRDGKELRTIRQYKTKRPVQVYVLDNDNVLSTDGATATLTSLSQDKNSTLQGVLAITLSNGIVVTRSKGAVRLWAPEGQLLRKISLYSDRLITLPPARFISTIYDKLAVLTLDGDIVCEVSFPQEIKDVLAFPNGKFVTWCGSSMLELWDYDCQVRRSMRIDGEISAVALTAKGCLAVTVGGSNNIYFSIADELRETSAAEALEYFEQNLAAGKNLGDSGAAGAIKLSDGRTVSWHEDYTLQVWSADGVRERRLPMPKRPLESAIELSPGRLLTTDSSDDLRMWRLD